MLLNEIINEVGMTKRAVKYYEEKGLLSVDKDNNGYRNYTAQDVETLKKISVYRKLGIGMADDIGILNHGHLLFEGTKEELKTNARAAGFPTDNLEDTFLAMIDEDNRRRGGTV